MKKVKHLTLFNRTMRTGLMLACALAAGSARADSLEIGYLDEPELGSGPGQFVADYMRAVEMIVEDSGLTVEWHKLPIRRLLHGLQATDRHYCVGGVTITEERRSLGQFTQPFRIDRMLAVVGPMTRSVRMQQASSLAGLAAQENSRFIAVEGINYGPDVTPLLRQWGERVSFAAHSTQQLLDMVRAGRADYALVPRNVGATVLGHRPDREQFFLTSYPDMRRDAKMAFLCGRSVPPAIIASLDAAILRQAPRLRALFPDQALAPSD